MTPDILNDSKKKRVTSQWGSQADIKQAIKVNIKNSLAIQWFRLHTSNAGGTGLTPDGRTKILHKT